MYMLKKSFSVQNPCRRWSSPRVLTYLVVGVLATWMLAIWTTPSKHHPGPSKVVTTDLPRSPLTTPFDISKERTHSALRNTLFPIREEHEGLHHDYSFFEVNHATLSSLMSCLELSNCKPNQDKGEWYPLCVLDVVSVAEEST